MSRRRAGRLLAALVLCGAGVAWLAVPSSAALRQTSAWWWRAQTGLVEVPPPPHVPPGGLAVARGLDGATAVSAVRFLLDDDEAHPTLTLRVASDFGGDGATLAACHTGSSWQPAVAGAWDTKPTAACDLGSVAGIRAGDGTTWTFPVAPLVVAGTLDLVLVPGTGSDPFDLAFEPVTSDDLATVRIPAGEDPPAPPPPPPTSLPTIPSEPFEPFEPSFDALPLPATPLRTFEPALPAEDQQVHDDAPVIRAQEEAFGRTSLDEAASVTDPRRLGILVLALGGASVAMVWGETAPEPQPLGPLRRRHPVAAGPDDGEQGIGRFRRRRVGSPPTLR